MENLEFRAFWSVIPATVLDDMSLPANAKILYGVLSSLMQREGYCWASNAQLAEAMHCSEDAVSRWVAALSGAQHIHVTVEPNRKSGGKVRRIWPSLPEPVLTEPSGGYSDKMPSTYSAKKPRVPGQTSVSQLNNKKIKKKREKASSSAVVASLFQRCDQYGMDVAQAMQRFLSMRAEIGKPLESEQAATMLWNKFMNLSGEDPAHMIALLDTATERQWRSLYALKDDELPAAPARREVSTEGVRFL